MKKKIYIGFFEDSQGAGSIQIAADIYGLIEVQKVFLHLSNGLDSFHFADLPLLDKKIRINLIAYTDSLNVGLRAIDNETYEWRVTKEKWGEFRHNLILLFDSFKYLPLYFESNSANEKDIQVVFSLDDFKQFEKSGSNESTTYNG